MRLNECCLPCLGGLAGKTISLSGGDENLVAECNRLIELLRTEETTPPAISNILLKEIRNRTGVADPFSAAKAEEYTKAVEAFKEVEGLFEDSLEGVVKLSALGNSMDFFTSEGYDVKNFTFLADMAKIKEATYTKTEDVLILGDNIGDFIFDMPLAAHLEKAGKHVRYAVRQNPVQNDLSMPDVERFGLKAFFEGIISTGTDEVGVRESDMRGVIGELWKSDATVIAKGMGNFETITQFQGQRPVIFILKVKCPAVAQATGHKTGTYIATLGGE